MLGIVMAAVGGLLFSFADAGKKAMTSAFSPEAIILITMTAGIVVNLMYLSLVGFPEVDWGSTILPALALGVLGAAGEALFMYGLRGTDLSLATPLLALTPVVAGLLDYLCFGEVPTSMGVVGVLVIIVGAYLLSVERPLGANVFQPFIKVLADRGCQLVLLAVVIGGVLFVGQKYGFAHSSPVFFVTLTLIVNWIIFAVLVVRMGVRVNDAPINGRMLGLIGFTGLTWAGGITLVCASFHYTLAAYASSGQQIQIPAAIALGALWFGEESFKQRLSAGLIMVVGVVLISLSVG